MLLLVQHFYLYTENIKINGQIVMLITDTEHSHHAPHADEVFSITGKKKLEPQGAATSVSGVWCVKC